METKSFSDLLNRAIAGDHEAIEAILELYMPLINKQSIVDDEFEQDCKQYIMLRIAIAIPKFII